MKTHLASVKFAGAGHYKITIQFRNEKYYEAITTDMELIDDYKSDIITIKDERRSNKAIKGLINVVKRANNLN
jgi:hypothetical protein